MHPYPHVYTVSATGAVSGSIAVASNGLPTLMTAAPREFDGPGDQWSPENLLCAALADCFILTFRAIARASKVEWLNIKCSVEGTLERAEGGAYFTRFITRAELMVSGGADVERCRTLLEKAEHSCLISNSLRGTRTLEANVVVQ
ncbi:MAG TPA: OsmC family protein [Steroidobacteraceae bacterium]|nr:OsmC family protein [Steroidobacteraceae bacterium]